MFVAWSPDLALETYPFVVIGAGPAGLHLAQLLAARGKVLVVEAGNAVDTVSLGDDIYEIVQTGRPLPELGTRLLAFGGSSNHWGGHSRPMSREAFGNRPGFPAWPIGYDDYAAYIAEAGEFLNVAPFEQPRKPSSIVSGIFAGHQHLEATQFHYSDPQVHFGDPGFVSQMQSDRRIDVLVDTRLIDIDLSSDGARVESISVLHRPSRETAKLAISQLFLCTGGVENARILLWSGRKYSSGNPLVGGPNELSGTHFTEKPYFWPVEMFVDSRADFTNATARPDYQSDLCWELTEDFRTKHGLPRFGVFPGHSTDVPATVSKEELGSVIYARQSDRYVKLDPAFQCEQTPHAGSYVRLSDDLDADGVARPELRWEISASDLAAYRKAAVLFCGVLSQNGVARCRLKPAFRAEDWSDVYIAGCNHHIGTTRMGATARDGVVDGDCKVFGLNNMFVAGSSVFPSCDYVNPTLNLVALAGRLARHILETRTGVS